MGEAGGMLNRYVFYGVTLELILVMAGFVGLLAAIVGWTYLQHREHKNKRGRRPQQGEEG